MTPGNRSTSLPTVGTGVYCRAAVADVDSLLCPMGTLCLSPRKGEMVTSVSGRCGRGGMGRGDWGWEGGGGDLGVASR